MDDLARHYTITSTEESLGYLSHRATDARGEKCLLRTREKWLAGDEKRFEAVWALQQAMGEKAAGMGLLPVIAYHPPGQFGNAGFLMMKAPGPSLSNLLAQGDLPFEQSVTILTRLLKALGYLHYDMKRVHNAVCDDSVYVAAQSRNGLPGAMNVTLGCLEYHCATNAQSFLPHMPEFAPPESYMPGHRSRPTADVYAAGMLALRLFMGRERYRTAFAGIFTDAVAEEIAARWRIWHQDIELPAPALEFHDTGGLSEAKLALVRGAIARMLSKVSSARFGDANEALDELEKALQGVVPPPPQQQQPEQPPPPSSPPTPRWWKRPWPLALLGGGILLLLAVLGVFLFAGERLSREQIETLRQARGAAEAARDSLDKAKATALESYQKGETAFTTADITHRERKFQPTLMQYEAAKAAFAEAAAALQAKQAEEQRNAEIERQRHAPRRASLGSSQAERDAALRLCQQHVAGCQPAWYGSELQREVQIKPFALDATEVTNRDFERFVSQQGYVTDAERLGYGLILVNGYVQRAALHHWRQPRGPRASAAAPEMPAVFISRNDAMAYCRHAGKRLPTAAEWEYAARGETRRIFPWGDSWDTARAVWAADGPQPVGSRPLGATPEGLLDMAGNVWEWTSSDLEGAGLLKGGSWSERTPANLRGAVQRKGDPGSAMADDGFRCARDLETWPVAGRRDTGDRN